MDQRIVSRYLKLHFLSAASAGFFFATYTLFLRSRGINLLEANLINACFMLLCVIFEVPTGAFADTFGRKKSVALGNLLLAGSFAAYYFSDKMWHFLLAESVGAIGSTLISGAVGAWLVDSLDHHGSGIDKHTIFAKREWVRGAGIVFSSSIGGWLGGHDLAWPWLASAIGTALTAAFAWRNMQEDYFSHDRHRSLTEIHQVAKASVKYGLAHRPVFYAAAFCLVFMFAIQPFNMQWNVLFKQRFDVPVALLGLVFAAIQGSIMLGAATSKAFTRRIDSSKLGLVIPQLMTVAGMLLAASLFSLPVAMFGLLFHEFGRGTIRPTLDAYVNQRIGEDQARATVLSFLSMVAGVGSFAGLVISGVVAERYSISMAWNVSALILLSAIIFFVKFSNGEEGVGKADELKA